MAGLPVRQNAGHRTSVLSRPSRRVTLIAVTSQPVINAFAINFGDRFPAAETY
jgi:hypothetical protein